MSLWSTMQADHDLVWDLLNQLTGGKGWPEAAPRERRQVALQLVGVESAHEVAEELVIWPAVRRHCPDGDELAGEALSQEREAKRALNELRRISAGNEEFRQCVSTVAGQARTHLSYEQSQIWPRLADRLSEAEGRRLEEQWRAARHAGPTRPHPHTPANPLVLGTAGRVLAGMDRARDSLTGRRVPTL